VHLWIYFLKNNYSLLLERSMIEDNLLFNTLVMKEEIIKILIKNIIYIRV
jgi:hypothetical protein